MEMVRIIGVAPVVCPQSCVCVGERGRGSKLFHQAPAEIPLTAKIADRRLEVIRREYFDVVPALGRDRPDRRGPVPQLDLELLPFVGTEEEPSLIRLVTAATGTQGDRDSCGQGS